MSIDAETLRLNLLDRRIDALKDAIGRSRKTWLFATLCTFIIGVSLFNITLGWTDRQIDNRARVVAAAHLPDKAMRDRMLRDKIVEKAFTAGGSNELSYLAHLVPESENQEDLRRALREMSLHDLKAHVTRRISFDTVQVPLLGLGIAGSDVGIIGGLGLALVGYWLLAALRGELHAFNEFVAKTGDAYTTRHSAYTVEESAYAFGAVRHYMIFTVSTKDSAINVVTTVGFMIPITLIALNSATTVAMLLTRPLGSAGTVHAAAELVIAAIVAAVWWRALKFQWQTLEAIQHWRRLVEEGWIETPVQPPPGWSRTGRAGA